MAKSFGISFLIILCFALIETTILSNISILPAVPDLVLICSLYISMLNGKLFGELSGFSSGLILDFLSGAPFGFNCIFRTLLGYVTGFLSGNFNFNGFFMPFMIVFFGTISKSFVVWLVSLFFPNIIAYNIFSISFIFELIENSLLAPVIFKIMNCFNRFIQINNNEE